MFYLLDPEKWERQKHFEYYMQMIPCGYTVTVRLDVENLYQPGQKMWIKVLSGIYLLHRKSCQ